jgi:hypothetical protein
MARAAPNRPLPLGSLRLAVPECGLPRRGEARYRPAREGARNELIRRVVRGSGLPSGVRGALRGHYGVRGGRLLRGRPLRARRVARLGGVPRKSGRDLLGGRHERGEWRISSAFSERNS